MKMLYNSKQNIIVVVLYILGVNSTQRINNVTCGSSTKYSVFEPMHVLPMQIPSHQPTTLSTLTGGSTIHHATIGPTVSDAARRTSAAVAVAAHPPQPRAAPLCKKMGPAGQSKVHL